MMNLCTTILVLLVAIVAGVCLYIYSSPEPVLPPVQHGWWGRGPAKSSDQEDASLRKVEIKISNDAIADFKVRLEKFRFTEDLDDADFQYGFQAGYMKEVMKHWQTVYDWRKYEKQLNRFDHFKTKIEGIDIHYLKADPADKGVKAKPLLMIHGWPGSVWEFNKILPMLTDPVKHGGKAEDTFQVFCPSIPGYGFSEQPHKKGFNSVAAARIFVEMMKRNGHERFYVQGGDWGSVIGVNIAQLHSQNVLGLHINIILGPFPGGPLFLAHKIAASLLPSLFLSEADQARHEPFTELFPRWMKESGYLHIQATKPDTVAWGLNNSPVGLAAYILEKFSTWTDPSYRDLKDGGLTRSFELDDLLTNVMIYWFTGTIGSSMRFYKENFGGDSIVALGDIPVHVPTGLANFPNELATEAEVFAAYKYLDIIQYTDLPKGGHFAAMEQAELLAEDVRKFVHKVEERQKSKSD